MERSNIDELLKAVHDVIMEDPSLAHDFVRVIGRARNESDWQQILRASRETGGEGYHVGEDSASSSSLNERRTAPYSSHTLRRTQSRKEGELSHAESEWEKRRKVHFPKPTTLGHDSSPLTSTLLTLPQNQGPSANLADPFLPPYSLWKMGKEHPHHPTTFHFPSFGDDGMPLIDEASLTGIVSPEERKRRLSKRERAAFADSDEDEEESLNKMKRFMVKVLSKSTSDPDQFEKSASYTPPLIMALLLSIVWVVVVSLVAIVISNIQW